MSIYWWTKLLFAITYQIYKPICVKDYKRELLDVLAQSYLSMTEMVVNKFREDLEALKNDVNDLKASI